MRRLMDFVTKNYPWDPLPHEFDVFWYKDGYNFKQPSDPEEWRTLLVLNFPHEKTVR